TAIQAGTLITTPVGSGPFRFVDWISGVRIRLDANLYYRGTEPHLGRLIFQVIPADVTRYVALQANTAQAADGLPNHYATIAASDPNLKVLWRPSINVGYLGMNRSHAPLGDVLVRQAIAHAINRQNIVASFFLTGDQVATQFLPPVIWGYDPSIVNYTYDPALARSLLTLAGYPNGITTTLAFRDVPRRPFPNISHAAQAIQSDLLAAGIHATLTVYESGVFLQKMANGELDLFLIGWIADYLHPDHFFSPILCDGYLAFGPRDDALCDQLAVTRATLTFAQQISQYQWASRRVHDTLPLLPVGHGRVILITRWDVLGLQPSPMGIEAFKGVYFGRLYLPLIRK
ncbi:MAG TPA: ABC transporter substrate-binding protein, partial [Anaerolineae bacterium]|nr:ABC transporter substrate-binding protein [Anaerolineae bacterium]